MRLRPVLVACCLALGASETRGEDPPPAGTATTEDISAERLTALVTRLSGPEFSGRASPGDREKLAMAVAEVFRAEGVAHAPGEEEFLRHFPLRGGRPAGTNVVGWIAGTSPEEHVLLAAHLDRRAVGDSKPSPAANGATGVAVLLEVARALAKGRKPRRSIALVAFDGSEDGQYGSRTYVGAPPAALSTCAAMLAIDRLGRSIGDVAPGVLFVHGDERAEGLAASVAAVKPPAGIVIRRLGLDLHASSIPDTIPFEEAKVPSLLLTAGWSRDDGLPEDVASKIDAAALAGRTRVVLDVVRALADLPERPVWIEKPTPRLRELEDVLALVRQEGEAEDRLGLSPGARLARKGLETQLASIVARGKVTAGERASARSAVLDVFEGLVARSK